MSRERDSPEGERVSRDRDSPEAEGVGRERFAEGERVSRDLRGKGGGNAIMKDHRDSTRVSGLLGVRERLRVDELPDHPRRFPGLELAAPGG